MLFLIILYNISFSSYVYRYLVGLILIEWEKLLGRRVGINLMHYMVVSIKL